MNKLVLFMFIVYAWLYGQSKEFAGPYKIVFRALTLCGPPSKIKFGTKVSRINRTALSYTSNLTIPDGINDEMQLICDLSIFGNGGWKPLFTHKFKACSDFRKLLPGILESFYIAAGYNLTACPIPPGTYHVKNWLVNFKFAQVILPYNKYRIKIVLSKKNVEKSCFEIDLDVVPDRMGQNK